MRERRASNETHHDMLGILMNGGENKHKLTNEEIIDQMITILYSGYETVSTTSMMAVKYLHDHPHVLQELRVSTHINCIFFVCLCVSSGCKFLIWFFDFSERAFIN